MGTTFQLIKRRQEIVDKLTEFEGTLFYPSLLREYRKLSKAIKDRFPGRSEGPVEINQRGESMHN